MLAIRKLSVGDGYQYLSRQVATGDVQVARAAALADYYAASGTAPGRWYGSGLKGLAAGIKAGDAVTSEAMTRVFRDGRDPTSGESLGVPFDEQHGGTGHAVAGFDLVFTVPKSASVLWALGDEFTRKAVVAAHHAALSQCVAFLEDNVVRTRVGAGGARQIRTAGLVAAAFEHVDSRLNDPNLHTHLVVANKVQGPDGTWRSLDGRTILAATVAVSELYDGLYADELSHRLPVTWHLRDRGERRIPAFAIDGLPDELLHHFSGRAGQIDAAQTAWETGLTARRGRRPTPLEVIRKRDQLTRATRPAKVLRPLAELFEEWANRARTLTGHEPRDLAARALIGDYGRPLAAHDIAAETLDALVARVVADVEARAATFTEWNLTAAASRATRELRMASPDERVALVGRLVVDAAGRCVRLDDGHVDRVGEQRYSTPAILTAEQDLLTTARAPLPLGVPNHIQVRWAWRDGPTLTADQKNAVAAVLTSGRVVDTVVGAAGTGKTTTLRAIADGWLMFHRGEILALAPSATAAHVLGDALGIRAETAAKWLYESRRSVGEPQWQLSRGQLVVLDEASLADTPTLAALSRQAAEVGAKLLLVGDPAQRPAVGPGGGFGMLTHQHTTARLTVLHRFVHAWEGDATLQVRVGDATVIGTYQREDRITAGTRDELLTQAVRAAAEDTEVGRVALLQAADNRTVHDLNARAQALAISDGRVAGEHGVPLSDESSASVGDQVVTRRNDRRLRTNDGHVRNGELWDVVSTGADGSLTVRSLNPRSDAVVRLPARYVAEHVELGYATTTARAQGSTVDVSRTVVTPAMSREDLYVAITRGREHNQIYVPVVPDDPDCPPGRPLAQSAAETLRTVLATTRVPMTALETWAAHHPGEPLFVRANRPQPDQISTYPPMQPYSSTPGPARAPSGRVVEL